MFFSCSSTKAARFPLSKYIYLNRISHPELSVAELLLRQWRLEALLPLPLY